MKVVITGADGQLGQCLQDRLSNTPNKVFPLSRRGLDITDTEAVLDHIVAIDPDVIINAAAYTAVDKAESDTEAAWAVNAKAVENLASAANNVSALFVHVSTDYVFDGSSSSPYKEADPVNPTGVYGASKLAGEKAAQQAERHIIVRTAWVFSEYGHNFLKTMVRLAGERDSLSIVNDQTGTPTYAGDLAAALVHLSEALPANGVYHFSGGEACTWFDFARAIFATCEELSEGFNMPQLTPISSSEFPTPVRRPAYSVLDGQRLKEEASVSAGDWRIALLPVCKKVLSL
ncbi:dTDP-4-dehydrorhamnose reductase [Marinobacter nitratireducens]|uniref:dTDP-4-dehydrorhamnose reductase n=1 Tax=Marinobacter nitratireducens TaxID=1137280 RepID=A0A072N3W6_9GAMM|nr:dTDP-4-dehydrorhamnose reductase [Marinobacter nitratireducens]KEF31643.1 dTDP-4-dehydrorhamnose reductase [Marinobacter nitratireducens]